MIEVSALLFTLLAEGTGLLSLILIVWMILVIRKKSKDKAAAQALVSNIKKHAEDRLGAIKTFLTTTGLEGEELQIDVKKIDRLEKDFFTQLVRLYLKRDGELLSHIDQQFDLVISGYKEKVSDQSGANTADEEDQNLAVIKTLEKEKEALDIELQITKTTMGNMMTEFNTMFSGGNETVQTSKDALQSSMAQAENDSSSTDGEAAIEEDIEVSTEATDSEENIDNVSEDDIDDIFNNQETKSIEAPVATEPKPIDDSGMEDVFFSADDEASAPKPLSESDDDFGSIVSSDDVDDLLDGIDLSKEID